MTVGELLRRMSSAELTEWRAFAMIEPFGSAIEDYRAGLYPAIRANAGRKEGDEREPVGPLDLFPWNHESNETQPAEEQTLTPEQEAENVRRFFMSMAGPKGDKP